MFERNSWVLRMMNNKNQYELALIHHEIEQTPVNQRVMDGYINATEMCKAAGKQFHDYRRLNSTDDYLEALSPVTGIPVTGLIQTIRGGTPEFQGTWVHPHVATNLAQWLSPKFAVQVSLWIADWDSGRSAKSVPNHFRRYLTNQHKIPPTHFSMLNQMVLYLLTPLETQGYRGPELYDARYSFRLDVFKMASGAWVRP